ncbi:MAG: hypothetical protein B1H08_06525 [Candidatus Omnitrophica bacterium 4484_171]|nr:MAG: hypothetical protein B1H08_06525 [Candidatus Omnitrophica bacterium 4484_171]RLE06785.1 MAG: hypothetical protein DRJ06_07155 [Candidatus Aminicenantes bacterium]
MKMVFIMYNIAINDEVMQILKDMEIEYYTRWDRATGCGKTSGLHLGNHIWPPVNSVLAIAVEDKKKDELIKQIKELRKKLGKEGIKAFVLPINEIT